MGHIISFNIIELVLLSFLAFLFLVQLIYYVTLYNRIHRRNLACQKQKVNFNTEYLPLSVIICARNESENLRKNLPAILEQDYPNFEVIVINDGATDESNNVLSALSEKYRHLYHSFTPESARYISRRKLALTLGIKASKYDWLVFIEVDCQPVSNQWLRLLARNFTPQTEIVLGYNSYERGKGWLHRCVAFDSLFQSLRYLGYALAGKPYMGMGRNMAYRRELFFNQKGYSTYLNLQRGEDDLFINQVATRTNTRVETDSNAVIRVPAVERYKEWKEEKLSYLATSGYFKGRQRYWLGLETATRLLFYTTAATLLVLGLVNRNFILIGATVLLILLRFLFQVIVINTTATEQKDTRRFYLSLPLLEIIIPLQSAYFRLYRLFRGKGDFMSR